MGVMREPVGKALGCTGCRLSSLYYRRSWHMPSCHLMLLLPKPVQSPLGMLNRKHTQV